jgi:hypothetical protein
VAEEGKETGGGKEMSATCKHCRQERRIHRKDLCERCYLRHGSLYPSKKPGRKHGRQGPRNKSAHLSPAPRRIPNQFLSAEWMEMHERRILAETARVQADLAQLEAGVKRAKEGRGA